MDITGRLTGMDVRRRIKRVGMTIPKAAVYLGLTQAKLEYITTIYVLNDRLKAKVEKLFDDSLEVIDVKRSKKHRAPNKPGIDTEYFSDTKSNKAYERKVTEQLVANLNARLEQFPISWIPDIMASIERMEAYLERK